MYLANNTRPHITFAVSLLARFSSFQQDTGMVLSIFLDTSEGLLI